MAIYVGRHGLIRRRGRKTYTKHYGSKFWRRARGGRGRRRAYLIWGKRK